MVAPPDGAMVPVAQLRVSARSVHTREATVSLVVNQLCSPVAEATTLYQLARWVVSVCATRSNRAIDDAVTSGANLYAPCAAGGWLLMNESVVSIETLPSVMNQVRCSSTESTLA